MSRYRSDPEMAEFEKPGTCSRILHYTWKTITCLFSHITLVSMVVSYCVFGAFAFEALEVDHEKEVKKGIKKLRENVTLHLWNFTQYSLLSLEETNFTKGALVYLKEFESALLKAMTKDGWDGEEDANKVQWTSTGALFYSIVVITTIGYGHIAPKTTWGKVATIFYAIIGIPLMLLCLSNIGDIMATSFRFLYWRVCCYVCTKKPKNKRRERGRSFRGGGRGEGGFSRSRNSSFRKSMKNSTKYSDNGYNLTELNHPYHSDTELRYQDSGVGSSKRSGRPSNSAPPSRRLSPNEPPKSNNLPPRGGSLDRKRFQSQREDHRRGNSLPAKSRPSNSAPPSRRLSPNEAPDTRTSLKDTGVDLDLVALANTKVFCNKYVVGKNDVLANSVPVSNPGSGVTPRNMEGQGRRDRRALSVPKTHQFLELPRLESVESSDKEEDDSLKGRNREGKRRGRSRSKSPMPVSSSPKMMTPLGYGYKSKYLDDPDSEDEYYYDEWQSEGVIREKIRPVPIWLCVLLVISYILAGAYIFKSWEDWEYLDSAYFCFITLTTIGFGDLVPAKGVYSQDVSKDGYRATTSIALCSMYLLFGISLLAMSFNLVQEEVISNVKSVAKTLGIIKSESDDSEEDV